MWPCKKKSTEDQLDVFRSFRQEGEKFNYMGIEMIVEDLGYFCNVPTMFAAYKDNHGELKHARFLIRELPALLAENHSEHTRN